ncbi:MAG: hypothetical protein IKK03_03690 [Lachnospiraceae bacterium]|nr:hypothetical protein [Lachnospiraceae bacterium]
MEVALNTEHRLTEVEQRSKSNSHRIDKLEPIVEEINTISKTMVQLVQEVKHTNEAVSTIDKKVERMDSRVDEMEKAPAKKWDKIQDKLLNLVLGAMVGFLMTGLIWAAVQAF